MEHVDVMTDASLFVSQADLFGHVGLCHRENCRHHRKRRQVRSLVEPDSRPMYAQAARSVGQANADPDRTAFQQQMDELKRYTSFYHLPPAVSDTNQRGYTFYTSTHTSPHHASALVL